jgi:putative ABC transport system ATP-binding protein
MGGTDMAGVQVDEITVEFMRGGHAVRPLDRFSFGAPAGSLTLLLGPSGCGKTTLLSCLAGILTPKSGRIAVHGNTITELRSHAMADYRRSGVGIVFQAFNLVPSLDATENVMVPLRAAKVARREASSRATELLTRVGLADRLRNKPAQLSGGQQQRVGIARALALDPALLLADEPTASLDHVQVETVLRILRGLADLGRTVIVATHDPRMLGLADHVIEMVPLQAASSSGPEDRHLAAGEVLFAQGSRGDRIYRVIDGEIELVAVVADEAEELLAVIGPGDEFGEMGAVFDLQRSATARARTSAHVVGYTVADFKAQFGLARLMTLIARYTPDSAPHLTDT